MKDIIKVTSAVPLVDVGNIDFNFSEIAKIIEQNKDANIIVFPELSITGYSCGDLFFQEKLIEDSLNALKELVIISQYNKNTIFVVGTPLRIKNELYNCAIPLYNGDILGIVPKTFLPNYNEFYEKRWFSSASDLNCSEISLQELGFKDIKKVPIGNNIVFSTKLFKFGIEICEDLWAPLSPSNFMCLNGAEIILNLSASNETIMKRKYREELVKQQSGKNICAYIYTSAGTTESTTDLIFSGNSIIAENGTIIKENSDFLETNYILSANIDLGKIRADRLKNKSFKDSKSIYGKLVNINDVMIDYIGKYNQGKELNIKKLPFVPSSKKERTERCKNIFDMQVAGLKKRLFTTGGKAIIGVSGGLDSTLALLVAVSAMKSLGKDPKNVIGVTMPGFGTTNKTYNNSLLLMYNLGITKKEISIKNACNQHFKDIGLDISLKDITYENVQARERTQILMDVANKEKGLVIGTGDLSELALGWCTYNGDHMSMYAVNTSLPKTLIRWMVDTLKDIPEFENCKNVLTDILDTPISPELLPPDENGKILQKTEDHIGPYALHDFFLYYMLRYAYEPEKIFNLAKIAFKNDFSEIEILKWMKIFYQRFFNQQFKRSCLPDGVKVGSVALSPRGDWRMPSDANAHIWIQSIEELSKDIIINKNE